MLLDHVLAGDGGGGGGGGGSGGYPGRQIRMLRCQGPRPRAWVPISRERRVVVEGGLCDDEDDDEDDEDGFLLTRGVQTPVFRLRLLYSTSIRLRFRLGWLTTGKKIQPDIIRLKFAPRVFSR